MAIAHGPLAGHSLPVVGVAAILCLAGAWATSRFFQRMTDGGEQRSAWLLLTGLASGVTIWCTHFVAMLGYHPGFSMGFGLALTALSLVIAVAGSAAGFFVAGRPEASPVRTTVGGVVVGLSVSAMHYVGMSAVHMSAPMSWNGPLVLLSVALGVVTATLALHAARSGWRHGTNLMWLLFAASVLLMHFTAMTAMRHGSGAMSDMSDMVMGTQVDPDTRYVLAIALATMSFVTIGAGVVGYLIDDRSRAASLERFRHLAMYDVLTGLPNRASLTDRLGAEILRARQEQGRLVLVVIDVDDFREINDLLGHAAGDEVLRSLGAGLAALARDDEEAFVAHRSGDEFVVLRRLDDDQDPAGFLEALRRALRPLVDLGGETITPRVSAGAAVFPDHAADAKELIDNAELAMHRAKGDPLADTCLYDPSIEGETRRRRSLAVDLRDAVHRGQLFLHYQLQASVSTGEVRGYEALLRWQHPKHGLVSPAEFIPLAEETRAIVPIGAWVLRVACAEAMQWEAPYRLSVNVSAVQLSVPGLTDAVRRALAETGLPPERLELEMTETALLTDRRRALRTLEEVKEMGVGVALDDFGVGYSSLETLRSFPFDRIKIDRSFFAGSSTPEQTVELIGTVLSLGRAFGMAVLAEGIETEDQLALLDAAGCDEVQGFLLGRPTPPEEIRGATRLSRRE